MSAMEVNSRRNNSFKRNRSKLTTSCGVCGIEIGKYKCPQCRTPYCSVKCCKEHKLKCPVLNQKDNQESTNCVGREEVPKNNASLQNSNYLPSDALNIDPIENARKRRAMLDGSDSEDDSIDEHGWRITKEMMEAMDNSSWLRKELSDGGLRQMIAEIDNADWESKNEPNRNQRRRINQAEIFSPRETALERTKYTNEKFAKFVDKLMLTAGVLVEKEPDPEINAKNFAALISGDIDPNNLALVSVPSRRKPKLETDNSSSSSSSSNDSDNDESSDGGSDGESTSGKE